MERQEFVAMEKEIRRPWNWLVGYMNTLAQVPSAGRTLLYGQNTNRNTVHVYLTAGGAEVVKVTYRNDKLLYVLRQSLNGDVQELPSVKHLLPTKHLHPAACDLNFCRWLHHANGLCLQFSDYKDTPVPASGFYGLILAAEGNSLIEATVKDATP